MAQSERLGVIPYSPLGGGLLTGKYGVDRRPDSGRLVSNAMYAERYGDAWIYQTAEASRPLHVTTATIPSAWRSRGSSHPAVTGPDHRRSQRCTARRVSRCAGHRHDARSARSDLGALDRATSSNRPRRRRRTGDKFSALLTRK